MRASRAPRKSARPSRKSTAAPRRTATRRSWPTTRSRAVINTTPNDVHLETTRAAAEAGKHVFLDKPIANTVADGKAITAACADAGVVLSVGYQRRRESHFRWIKDEIDAGRFGKLVQAEGNISRDRLGQIDLSSWRYQAAGMPGGVMLQIGIHYTDVLEMLMGPIKRVSGMSAQLVLPGDNPDVANLILEHENGAISNLTASYASASEYYMMNIYGKEASAYYDLFGGLRHLRQGGDGATPIPCDKNDTIVEELEEFAACVRGDATPEVGGAARDRVAGRDPRRGSSRCARAGRSTWRRSSTHPKNKRPGGRIRRGIVDPGRAGRLRRDAIRSIRA